MFKERTQADGWLGSCIMVWDKKWNSYYKDTCGIIFEILVRN